MKPLFSPSNNPPDGRVRLFGRHLASLAVLLCLIAPAAADARGGKEHIRARTIIHDDGSRTYSRLDRNKHQLGETVFDEREVLIMYKQFRLDNQDRPLVGAVYDGAKNLLARIEYGYDNFGRMLEERMFDPRGRVIRRVLYRYNGNGDPTIRAIDYDPTKQAPPKEVDAAEVEPTIVTPNVLGARPREGDEVFEDGSRAVPRVDTRRQR